MDKGSWCGDRALLWREAVGHELRTERTAQQRTQADVAHAAGISTQYLSEVERGRKEPSSEILRAASGALGIELGQLVRRAAGVLAPNVGGPTPSESAGPEGSTDPDEMAVALVSMGPPGADETASVPATLLTSGSDVTTTHRRPVPAGGHARLSPVLLAA